jgi:hypothetical protein
VVVKIASAQRGSVPGAQEVWLHPQMWVPQACAQWAAAVPVWA